MSDHDNAYLSLLSDILHNGLPKSDRTGVGTISLFGRQLRFGINHSFPLLTTKKVHFKSIVHELLWFISGDTNVNYLTSNGVKIWNEWADENGDLGPVYGKQWRQWDIQDGYIDQLGEVINTLKVNPYSRRIIVTSWNPSDLDKMALAPCHCLYQFYVHENDGVKYLSCQLYQRSADIFLGVPFNIASYALLTIMIAHELEYIPYEFIHTFGDVHLYNNHINQANEQLSRSPFEPPKVELNPNVKRIFDFKYEDIKLVDYKHHPPIKAQVAV